MLEIHSILSSPGATASRAQAWSQRSPIIKDAVIADVHASPNDVVSAMNFVLMSRGEKTTRRPLLGNPARINELLQCLSEKKKELRDLAWLESGRSGFDFEAEYAALTSYLISFSQNTGNSEETLSRGVCVVISSSVWPLFYLTQFALANLAVGNQVILKPSERVSCISHLWFSYLKHKLPEWSSVQVIFGGPEVGRRLACHEGVDIVIFQGSYEVGMRLKQDLLPQPSKELLLYLGAKNPIIISDAPSEDHMSGVIRDAFVGSGQNCLSAHLLFVRHDHLRFVTSSLTEMISALSKETGSCDGLLSYMQDSTRTERYLKFLSVQEKEGAQVFCKGGRSLDNPSECWVRPQLSLFPEIGSEGIRKLSSFHTDVFGPHLTMVTYRDVEELFSCLGALSYGHSCGWLGEVEDGSSEIRRNFGRIKRNGSLYQVDFWKSPLFRKRSGNHATYGARLLDLVSMRDNLE